MGDRLSKIYTRTGDQGQTGLGDGARVAKDDLRIECLGEIDELNAAIGVFSAHVAQDPRLSHYPWSDKLSLIQHGLFDLGAELCRVGAQHIDHKAVQAVEQDIDQMNLELPKLQAFILPSGSPSCSAAHLARTICRRAERHLVRLQQQQQNLNPYTLQFVNRLSDWFFVAARLVQKQAGLDEVLWQKNLSARLQSLSSTYTQTKV